MATNVSDNLSDEIINIKCCLCDQDNRVREASKYCVQCKDYYCAPCIEIHRKIPATKEHKLLDKSELRSQGHDGSLPSFPTLRCTLHPDKVVDMFCGDHNEAACASCIFLSHRTCRDVHSIPEKIDTLYNRADLTKAKKKIHKTKANMEDIKREKERKVKELKDAYDREVESVRSFRQELQTLLDSMEEQTIQELTKEYQRIEASLTDEINDVNILIDAMNEVSSQLMKSDGNKSQEFICVKSSEKVTAQAEDVGAEQQQKTKETVSFDADQKIKIFLQRNQVLGMVSCKTFEVKFHKEIDVKLTNGKDKDDRECYIWGLCMTAEGSVLLTDSNNKKLKRTNVNTGKINDYVGFKADPRDVCMVNMKESAVTTENFVHFVSLGNKMTPIRKLTMNHACWGLAYNDEKLFVCDGGKNVYIHDMDGRELRTVSRDASGKEIFQRTRHITPSDGGDRVFVADVNNGLIILDHQGNYLSTLTDPTLLGTQAVCTAGTNLFVSGLYSHNIFQIGQNYKFLGELMKIREPFCLCFDPRNTRLIASQCTSNKITVLDLER